MRALVAVRTHDTIVLSPAVLAEITEVVSHLKFARAISPDRRDEIVELLTAVAVWFEPRVPVTDCPDPDDNKYLELALAADAKLIMSSDRHLFAMQPWREVDILRPAEYLAIRQ